MLVGIGASAGGLRPIEEFFSCMPSDSGMAFIVVQHLSPDFKSLMDELLSRYTRMSIYKVTDGIALQPNCIYLIPPKKDLAIAFGKLVLQEPQQDQKPQFPIDNFFGSMAEQLGSHGVGIVLSGSGTDGSRGVQKINDAGGMVLVQSPESADFDGMPRAAIATDSVDFVCAVEEMPTRLIEYSNMLFDKNDEAVKDDIRGLARLHQFYKVRMGTDFSFYKPNTLKRRLERRAGLNNKYENVDDYLDQLELDEEEAEALYRDLLVDVTHFFRDPAAFSLMREKIIPQLIEESHSDEEFRVWVCGCSTGEEAYSIAMIIHEYMEKEVTNKKPFKVFATDVHPGSIECASDGLYKFHSLRFLPGEMVTRYFHPKENGFKISQEIRQRVIFANNDATKDPPFTRLHLISCRNMLIYLLPQVQKRVLSVFHFGLVRGGVLFLGPSETVGQLADEFEQVDEEWKVFRKRRNVRLPTAGFGELSPGLRLPKRVWAKTSDGVRAAKKNFLGESALNNLLNQYLPSSLMVDEHGELIRCIGDARRLLSIPEGKKTNNIFKLLDSRLVPHVRTSISRCKKSGSKVGVQGVPIDFPGNAGQLYEVQVEQIEEKDFSVFLVSFIDMNLPVPAIDTEVIQSDNSVDQIDQLQLELNFARETLKATVEELESSNEELQATNEELIASNEELQSTNEELQSTNEELNTVNLENRQRIEQLDEVTEELELLLRRTETGILILDRDLKIRKFTRSITRYFKLQPGDMGRSIDNFSNKTGVPNLYFQLGEVIRTGCDFMVETRLNDQETLMVEAVAKKEGEHFVGLTLTVGQKTSAVGAGFWTWPNVEESTMWWSPRCYRLLGYQEGDLDCSFSGWRSLVHEADKERLRDAGTNQCAFVRDGYLVLRMRCADDTYRKFEYRAEFIRDDNERPKSMYGSVVPYT